MQHDGKVIVEPYTEHYPPDVGAIKLWLTNRRPKEWRERTEQDITTNVRMSVLSDAALHELIAREMGKQ